MIRIKITSINNNLFFHNPKNNITKLFYLLYFKNSNPFYYPTLFQIDSNLVVKRVVHHSIDQKLIIKYSSIFLTGKEFETSKTCVQFRNFRSGERLEMVAQSLNRHGIIQYSVFIIVLFFFFTVWSYIEMDAQWYFAFTSRNGTVLFARKRDFSTEGRGGYASHSTRQHINERLW